MKTTLIASIALIALGTGLASAADLPVKAEPVPVPSYVPVPFTWTGCYVGGNIGAAWADNNWSDTLFGLNWSNNNNGRFIGGGEVGCNYQINGNLVIGAEGDFDWLGNNNSSSTIVGPLG